MLLGCNLEKLSCISFFIILYSLFSFSDPAFDVSMKVSVEMPFEIRSLDSPTHAMKVKVIFIHSRFCGALFHCVSKDVTDCIGYFQLCFVTGPENSRLLLLN